MLAALAVHVGKFIAAKFYRGSLHSNLTTKKRNMQFPGSFQEMFCPKCLFVLWFFSKVYSDTVTRRKIK